MPSIIVQVIQTFKDSNRHQIPSFNVPTHYTPVGATSKLLLLLVDRLSYTMWLCYCYHPFVVFQDDPVLHSKIFILRSCQCQFQDIFGINRCVNEKKSEDVLHRLHLWKFIYDKGVVAMCQWIKVHIVYCGKVPAIPHKTILYVVKDRIPIYHTQILVCLEQI